MNENLKVLFCNETKYFGEGTSWTSHPPEQDSHAWNVAGSACQRALAWEKAALAAGGFWS